MRINYNVSAMLSNNALSDNDNFLAKSLERLSSGLKLNHAKDNPAGLAMAKRMNAQIEGLSVANQNASDGVSIIETADGAMTEISEMLQRMNELAIKAATDTVSENDKAIIQDEIAQLKEEITRISEVTEFNTQKLLNGNFSLKGYTNNKDVKVLSYSEEVPTKEYTITSMTVSYCEEEGIYKIEEGYVLGEDFPEGAKAAIKDDLVIITADNGFEMQLDISRLNYAGRSASSETVTEVDENGETIERERVWKSVSFPSDEIPGVKVDGNTGDYVIEAITVEIKDGKLVPKVVGGTNAALNTIKWQGDAPSGYMEITISGDQMTIKLPNGSPITLTFDPEYLAGSTGDVTFSLTGIPSLSIDATGIGPMRLQVGSNEGQIVAIDIPAVNLKNMGIEDIDVSTREGALDAITRIDDAVHFVSSVRGRLGAYQNRLESTINNLDVITENITAAYSRIMDVDMAEEMTKYTTYQVLTQAGTSMLAQANERPSQVLQLLQ